MLLAQTDIWVDSLISLRDFYTHYLQGSASEIHHPSPNFSSCKIRFPSGEVIELMHSPGLQACNNESIAGEAVLTLEYTHRQSIDSIVKRLKEEGYSLRHPPNGNEDGSYSGTILDPEGNAVKLLARNAG